MRRNEKLGGENERNSLPVPWVRKRQRSRDGQREADRRTDQGPVCGQR